MKKIISILLVFLLVATPLFGCSRLFGRKSEPVLPHLISYDEREQSPSRPINNSEIASQSFATTDAEPLELQLEELLQIVIDNKRPDFSQQLSPTVKEVYDNAIKILNRYIKNDFSTFERVHAIHDYLTSSIKYDENLYLEHLSDPETVHGNDPSFLLEGVFINKLAVCTGFAKSFRLLCGIEGIKTESVTGAYSYNGSSIPHIWNKVEIDSVWYNIDCTMDSITFNQSKGDPINVIHHGYFLLSDTSLSQFGGHIFGGASAGYPAVSDYPFHATQNLFEGTQMNMQVNSQEEFNAVFNYIKNSKRKIGQVELRVNMGLSDAEANLQEAYSAQITKVYSIIKDKDFSFSPERGRIPYQKYPKGVFVFLIYK